ncbi:hypothetical protein [Adhaeribacter radiodurans]|uniref:Uncharacterized protein n=1 Tax=Adhaeribacter radiodurans TaxID=2745197 RepID=A0A7L7L4G3_9BACT|nr:hypothetical protein [Adhaeribacter radiodurans]QMU27663.1 hypothetical protein HUW48_06205 [Adhaeribacter radiodurans]
MNEQVKVSSFGKQDKTLIITDTTIQLEKLVIKREEITEIIYDIQAIVFYRFLVGRKYHIGFKTPTQQLNLIFRSYFGISQEYFTNVCNRIIEEVWEKATDTIWRKNKNLLLAGDVVQIGQCQLHKNGIFLIKQQKQISWENLHYEVLYDRLVLNHKNDSSVYTNLYFANTWNIDILISLLDWITKENGLAEWRE